jgi:hypothetical protein
MILVTNLSYQMGVSHGFGIVIELTPFKPCMLGVDCLWPCWRVSLAKLYLLNFALLLFCRCFSLSPSRRESFLRMTSLGQGATLDHRVTLPQIFFILTLPLKTL